jgi:hypothetical protein
MSLSGRLFANWQTRRAIYINSPTSNGEQGEAFEP